LSIGGRRERLPSLAFLLLYLDQFSQKIMIFAFNRYSSFANMAPRLLS
jgi:hypothetical protein